MHLDRLEERTVRSNLDGGDSAPVSELDVDRRSVRELACTDARQLDSGQPANEVQGVWADVEQERVVAAVRAPSAAAVEAQAQLDRTRRDLLPNRQEPGLEAAVERDERSRLELEQPHRLARGSSRRLLDQRRQPRLRGLRGHLDVSADGSRDGDGVHLAGRDQLGNVRERGHARRDGSTPLGLDVDDRCELHAIGAREGGHVAPLCDPSAADQAHAHRGISQSLAQRFC